MFITHGRSGYIGTSQVASGFFLMLMNDKSVDWQKRSVMTDTRGLVVYTRMEQLGHFMMSKVKIAGHVIVLSGSYGGDGLPHDVPHEVYELGVPVPESLMQLWNTGGGHNEAGSEAKEMRKWALEQMHEHFSKQGWWRKKYARFL